MPAAQHMLLLAVGSQRYAAQAQQVIALRRIDPAAADFTYGSVLVPLRRLSALIELSECGEPRHALLVAAGGHWQGLAVDAVETLHELGADAIRPLPKLLDRRRNAAWAAGTMTFDDQLVLVLDLEAIVRTIRCNA